MNWKGQPMSDELERYTGTDSWANILPAVGELSQRVAGTEFVNRSFRGKPASVAAAILAGRELGLGPMTSMRGLHVIEGQVTVSAQLVAAKILSAGHRIDWIESTDKAAEVRIVRGDRLGEATARFTMKDAERANLAHKANWQRYPAAMLQARALTNCAHMIAADCILGLEASEPSESITEAPSIGTTVVQLPERVAAPRGKDEPTVPHATTANPATQQPATLDPGQPETVEDDETKPYVSDGQIRKLNALLTELERIDNTKMTRDQRRSVILTLAEAPELDSAKQLTYDQASTAIDRLTSTVEAAREADGRPSDE